MKLPFFLIAVGLANAHAIFLSFEVDVNNEISYNVRTLSNDATLTDVDSDSLACNGDLNLTTSTKTILAVATSSTVHALWRRALYLGPEDVMDASHFGPVMAYLKKVDAAVMALRAAVSGSRSGKRIQ